MFNTDNKYYNLFIYILGEFCIVLSDYVDDGEQMRDTNWTLISKDCVSGLATGYICEHRN